MSTIYYDIECDFTQIPNHIILNPEISGTAKAIYFYIIMRIRQNKEWEFYDYDIMSHLKEGRDAFRNAKKELIEYGYLIKIKQNIGGNGKYKGCEYAIKKEPITRNPTSVEPQTGEPTSGNPSTNNKKPNNNINNKQSNKDKTTASGSSFNENSTISKIENVQTSYQGNLDNSTGKENLQVESQSYILNSQEKDRSHPAAKQPILAQKTAESGVNTNGSTLPQNSGYSVEFEEFWERWGLMCKEKGSATGTKKEAYNEWQKVYKICGHQGIMRVLGAFIEYILIAFEPNKHACRWFKIIEWKDIETVINDYKTQAENIKAVNISKQKSKATNGFNKQPQAPITIKAVVTPEQQNEATEIEARRIKRHSQMKPNEVECLEKLKPTLKNYFGDNYKPTIEKLILNIKGNEYTFFEGVSVFTRQENKDKLAMIVKRELQNDDIEIKVALI
jgi:hypothetical protein